MIKWLYHFLGDEKYYGQETTYVGTNNGRQSLEHDEVYVRLLNGNEIKIRPIRGGWMGPTKERPFPDFEETK